MRSRVDLARCWQRAVVCHGRCRAETTCTLGEVAPGRFLPRSATPGLRDIGLRVTPAKAGKGRRPGVGRPGVRAVAPAGGAARGDAGFRERCPFRQAKCLFRQNPLAERAFFPSSAPATQWPRWLRVSDPSRAGAGPLRSTAAVHFLPVCSRFFTFLLPFLLPLPPHLPRHHAHEK